MKYCATIKKERESHTTWLGAISLRTFLSNARWRKVCINKWYQINVLRVCMCLWACLCVCARVQYYLVIEKNMEAHLWVFQLGLSGAWASLVAQLVKNPPAMWETWVRSLGWEDPLEKGKAIHPSILAWRIPWTVQSMKSQRVRHDWMTFTSLSGAYREWDMRCWEGREGGQGKVSWKTGMDIILLIM